MYAPLIKSVDDATSPFSTRLKKSIDHRVLYSDVPHPVSSLHIYTFFVSRAFMAGVASQAGDADFSRAPGLTSGLQGLWMSTARDALLLVPQWQCISSFVFYIAYEKQEDILLCPINKPPRNFNIYSIIWRYFESLKDGSFISPLPACRGDS